MVQVRLAAGGGLLPSQDPVYGLEDFLFRWVRKGRYNWDVRESETEAHLSLEAMLPRVVPSAVRLVLLELAPDPESLLTDATAEGAGPAAPLAGERLARHLGHPLLLIVFLLTHHMGFVQTRQFKPYLFATK
jgi:hypothetical protein